jgi:uncharacterized membrane protein YeiH
MVTLFFDILDIIGSLAFAISGALAGKRKQMDGFGIVFLASVTTFGGGLTRDMLLASRPVALFETPRYLLIAVVAGLAVRYIDTKKVERQALIIALFDACGLAVFTAFGTMRAIEAGAPIYGGMLMGMITGCVGGMLRDVLLNQPPMVLYGDFYARACLLGSTLLYTLHLGFKQPEVVSIVGCVALVLVIRLYVIAKSPHYKQQIQQHLKPFSLQKPPHKDR